jgi:23S rRNA (uracil1939-C5)-methyltransferase
MKQRNSRPLPLVENVTITGVAAEGKSIARVGDMVLFIPYGAPGDVVDVQLTLRKKHFMEGEIVRFHTHSAIRTEPFCAHFGTCGGCKWQHLPYPVQLETKHQQVVDALERIGGFTGVEVAPIIGSENDRHYRNKLEFTFTCRRWLTRDELLEDGTREPVNLNGLGFHLRGSFDRILDISQCFLQPEPSNAIRMWVHQTAGAMQIPYFNHRSKEGVMRNIIIRNNRKGEFMVIVVVTHADEKVQHMMAALGETFPDIISLHLVTNPKRNDDIADLEPICIKGDPWLTDEMDGLHFRIGPKSFYQTNANQVTRLYRTAIEFAALTPHETVYDLYTGTGTIANFAARSAGKVVGIEYVAQAIEDARQNSLRNQIHNTTFVAGDMARVLNGDFIEKHGSPHVIITDPPRAGMHPDVVKQILSISPNRIVYISCNPATQARDVALMKNQYRIAAVQPIDMFPHTHHVENVILLVK